MAKKIRVPKFIALLFTVGGLIGAVGGASMSEQCGKLFQEVQPCLPYATGTANAPERGCCTAVTDIRNSNPVCLCYVIQQIHDGANPQLRSLGLQEQRLLQLPSACRLPNATLSNCPSLLNIPPSSPDYAIFNNNASTTTPTGTPTTPATRTSSSTANESSNGLKHGLELSGSVAVAMAIIFFTFPAGFVSSFRI